MTAWKHRLTRALGLEWWFLLALVPLIGKQPVVSFTHDVLIVVFLIGLVAAVVLRKRIGSHALSAIAYVALLPVVALALFRAGRLWGTLLVLFWAVVLVWYLLRDRPVIRPAKGPLMWLTLVSVSWAVLFLVVADLFLGGVSAGGRSVMDRFLSLAMVLGLFAVIAIGGVLWKNRRDSPAPVTTAALMALCALLISEGRHDLRLWRGVREVERLEEQGAFNEARALLNELWGLSRAKGQRFVHPDLALASARLDVRDEYPDRAVGSLVWVAEHAPKRQADVCRLLDEQLVNHLLQMPAQSRDAFALFSDFEYAPDGGLFLLDRWGRVFRTDPDSSVVRFLFADTLANARVAVDLERVGEEGFLVLDHSGEIHFRGVVPQAYQDLVKSGGRRLPEAVDLELCPSGEGFYVVNAYGAIAAYGATRFSPGDNPHSWNFRIIRDLEIAPEEKALVLLDGYGGLHSIGELPFDPKQPDAPYWFEVLAEDIEFWPHHSGMYLMNRRGEWARFGDAPVDPASPYFPRIGGVDFEIDGSRGQIAVMRASGAVERFDIEGARVEDLIAAAKAAKDRGQLREVWEKAEAAALLEPEVTPTLRALFDEEYYQSLSRKPVDAGQPFPLLRRLARAGVRSYFLDAWGQILVREQDGLRLLAGVPSIPSGQWAVDFQWLGNPPRPVILTDKGEICYPDDLSEGLRTLLEQCPRPIAHALRLEVTEQQDQGYVLDEFGEIHPFGARPVGSPAEWQARWGERMAIDFAVVGKGAGILILDRHGGLHTIGSVATNVKTPSAPWWRVPIACALTANDKGDSIAVLSRHGDLVPLGGWRQGFQPAISPWERAPYAVDLVFSPAEGCFRVLSWNGQERVVPLGRQSAEVLAMAAVKAVREGQTFLAVEKLIQAAKAAPDLATQTLEACDGDFLQAVAAGPFSGRSVPDLVARALPGDRTGALLVLDRFGRIWEWADGSHRLICRQTIPLRGGETRRAIAFGRRGDGFAVLDNLGGITAYHDGKSEYVVQGSQLPSEGRYPVDLLVWEGGFLVLDSFGEITAVGVEKETLPVLPDASWTFPIARRLHRIGDRVYVLDGLGGIHAAPGGSQAATRGAAYFTADLVRDFEPDPSGGGFFVMDFAGRLSRTERAEPSLNRALLPPEAAFLEKGIRDFEIVQRGIWRERDLGEREFDKHDYTEFDAAVDLVCDPRDESLYILFRNGRVAPIWTRKADAQRYVRLADRRRGEGDIHGRIRELTRALALDQDLSLLESMNEGSFAELSRCEEPFLDFFRDLEISDQPGNAYVLDRWGRIFEWSNGPNWRAVSANPLPQGEEGKGEAVAFASGGGDSFVVLTRAGELVPRGSVPPQMASLLAKWDLVLNDAVDLAFSDGRDLAAIVTAHGEVWRLTAEGAELWPGDRLAWEDKVVRAVALRADGRGCVVYDYFGGIHRYGEFPPAVSEGAPYFNLPLMADIWIDPTGDRAAFLRSDGIVEFSDRFGTPPWHTRFLAPATRRFRPSVPHVWEALNNQLTPAEDVELSPDGNALFILRGNGRVIRVWKSEEGAREEAKQAKEAAQSGDVAAAVVHLDRAAFLGPDSLGWPEVRDLRVAEKVYQSDVRSASWVPLFVDMVIVEGSPCLLDRWGGLHQMQHGELVTIREFGRTANSGACAVGVASSPDGAWIAYEDGEIEVWSPGKAQGSILFSANWPEGALVDIAVDPDGKYLFGCFNNGQVLRLDPQDGSQQLIYSANWSFPLALTYVAESPENGYLMDRFGTVHHVGKTSIFTRYAGGRAAPYWDEGWARDLCLSPRGTGLFLLDAFSGVHLLGATDKTVSFEGLPYFDVPAAVRVLVYDNRILVLDGRGHVYASQPLPSGI